MGHRLREVPAEGGLKLFEKACENYTCRSCGGKMIYCNFVYGVCIQVFVLHGEKCEIYRSGSFRRPVEVDCRGCIHYNENDGCTLEGEDQRINSVRTNA